MKLLAVLLVAAAAGGGALVAAPSASALQLSGTVSEVVDGDTIKVISRGFETPVRLIGIDTPETRHPDRPVQCFGPAASARLKRLLPAGRRVTLVTDPTQDTRDRYGRLLAYVHRPGKTGPRGSVNFALVATGHAKVYVYGGIRFRHADAFFRAQSRARTRRAGLWGPPCRGNTTKPDPSVRAPASTPAPAAPGAACDPNYAGACIPVHPPDIDCGDIPDRDFRVVGTDVHDLDADGNGIACEK